MRNSIQMPLSIRPLIPLVFLSLCGMFLIVTAQIFLNLQIRFDIAIAGTAMIFGIYTINRYTDLMEDFVNDTKQAFFFKSKQYLFKFGIVSITLSMAYLAFTGLLDWYHFILLAGGITYSYSLIPWYKFGEGFKMIRLKEVFLLKNLVVSFLWGVSVFAFPLASVGKLHEILLPQNAILVLGLCFSTFYNSLFNDILDRSGDHVAGSKTLATLLGDKISYLTILSCMICWQTVLLTSVFYNWVGLGIFTFLTLLNLFPMFYILPYLMKKIDEERSEFIAEFDLPIFTIGLVILAIV